MEEERKEVNGDIDPMMPLLVDLLVGQIDWMSVVP